VAQAVAAVQRAQADLGQMKAKSTQAKADWERAQKLGPSDALSQASYDQYKANYDVAIANVGVGEAALEQAKAAISSAQAGLDRSERNLGYCVIASPVDGVIVDRRVNIGQTVVSSLNAPSLFLIAKDLRRVQVWVAVNEADIGNITAGQPVTFTVDALPGRTFKGKVNKVRLNATMTQNVVTYTVEVTADNSDGKLLPYLTANVRFETARHPDVLMVPNTALRWTPAPEQIAPEAKQQAQATSRGAGSRGQVERGSTTQPSAETGGRGMLWVKTENSLVKPVAVKTGPTDGISTEVSGKDLTDGMEVVIGAEKGAPAADSGGAASPFTPQFRRR
jgi:HlyD family secretion protein